MNEELVFTTIADSTNGQEWPDGRRSLVHLVAGPLAERICAKLGVHLATPVVIAEEQTDGGYSEWTQETDYQFTLRVGYTEVNLASYDHYNQVNALSKWLEDADV